MKNELSAPFPKYLMVDALIIIFKSAFMVWFRQGCKHPQKWYKEEECWFFSCLIIKFYMFLY